MGGNYSREFKRRSQLFVRRHNETLSVVAVRVSDPNLSPVGINAETQSQLPTGFDNSVINRRAATRVA
jgi:hypothetical protein